MIRWVGALAMICALATPVWADDREEAGKAFTAGQAADRKGKWEKAITHYLRAYSLLPHPNAAYNIALDLERLGRLREAYDWYGKYVDTTSDPTDRARVETQMEELRARPAPISVSSSPKGARVLIDGTTVAPTPYRSTISEGRHVIVVRLSDQQREERVVTVEFGERVVIDVRWDGTKAPPPVEPPPAGGPGSGADPTPPTSRPTTRPSARPSAATGALRVVAAPDGAFVSVDNQPIGPTPIYLVVAPGAHQVTVVSAGFVTHEERVLVTAGAESVISPRLTSTLATVAPPAARPKLGLIAGAGLGVALGEETKDPLLLGELGTRILQYDLVFRIGAAGRNFLLDAGIRYSIGGGRFVPFLGGAYTWQAGVSGYAFLAGFRVDLSRGKTFGTSFVIESGLRAYFRTPSGSETMPEDSVVVPVIGYFEIVK